LKQTLVRLEVSKPARLADALQVIAGHDPLRQRRHLLQQARRADASPGEGAVGKRAEPQVDRSAQDLAARSHQVSPRPSHPVAHLVPCRVEEDLKKNLNVQKVENVKLQNQISSLKQEKTQLQQNLIGLQRRIGELELSIGGDQQHFQE